jgi:hypothetical protein
MNTLKMLMLGSAVALVPMAAAAADPEYSEIDVTVELAAADGANALDFWPTLEADVEGRLAQALADQTTTEPNQSRLVVTIDEVSVDGNALLVSGGEFNTLDGTVSLYPPLPEPQSDGGDANLAPTTASAGVYAVLGAPDPMPDPGERVLLLAPSDEVVYEAMLDKFVEVVLQRVEAM